MSVRWTKDGIPLETANDTFGFNITTFDLANVNDVYTVRSVLLFPSLTRHLELEGIYECLFVNLAGIESSATELHIQGEHLSDLYFDFYFNQELLIIFSIKLKWYVKKYLMTFYIESDDFFSFFQNIHR